MATATELLRLVIDADAKGALAGMEAVGVSAEKNLGKTDDKMRRIGAGLTTFGAGMATAGAVVGVGLFKLAQMSEDAEQQSRKLANSISNSDHVFRANGDALRDQAQALQQVTAADADAVIGAQSLLVQFGMTEDQVSNLTPLMVDLSRKMGVDFDTAAKAIGKSVEGSSGALKKMGIVVDETKFAIDPFAATVEALRGTVGGFAEQEGKTFSGQLEIMKNNLGDLGEAVGGGAAGVLSGITEKIGDMAHYLGETNPELGSLVGKLSAIGSVAAVGGGGLSFVVGQAMKLREALTVVGDDGARSLTNVGKAASGVAIGGAIIAGWMALDAAMMAVTESSEDVAAGVDRMKAASTQGDALTALIEQSQTLDGTWEDVKEGALKLSTVFGSANTMFKDTEVAIAGTTLGVKDIDEALSNLAQGGDWEQLTLFLDALESSGADLEQSGLSDVIDKYRDRIDAAAEASASAGAVVGESAGAYEELGVSVGEATSAYEAYNSAIIGSLNSTLGLSTAAVGLAESQRDVMTATAEVQKLEREGKTGTDEYAKAVEALDDANWDATGSAIKQQEAVQKLAADLEAGKVSTDAASAAVDDLAASGAITAGQADILRFHIGLATGKLEELGRQNPKPTVSAETGGFWEKVLPVAAWEPADKDIVVHATITGVGAVMDAINNIQNAARIAIGRVEAMQGRAVGGPVNAGEVYVVGEKGPELFVSDRAGTIVPNHRLGSSSGGSPVGGGGSVNITVNTLSSHGVESAVVDALARANRAGLAAVPGVR